MRPEKISALVESIESTGFWDNIVGRKSADGDVEIAYGHHRLAALRKSKVDVIDIPVRDLADDAMLKIMSRENMKGYQYDAAATVEVARATLDAYAEGKIDLPPARGTGPVRELTCGSGASVVVR